jgi:hypothetical protein
MGSKPINLDAGDLNSWSFPNGLVIANALAKPDKPVGSRVVFHDVSERAIEDFAAIEGAGDDEVTVGSHHLSKHAADVVVDFLATVIPKIEYRAVVLGPQNPAIAIMRVLGRESLEQPDHYRSSCKPVVGHRWMAGIGLEEDGFVRLAMLVMMPNKHVARIGSCF